MIGLPYVQVPLHGADAIEGQEREGKSMLTTYELKRP